MAEPEAGLPSTLDVKAAPNYAASASHALRRLLVEERPRLEQLVRARMPKILLDRESATDLAQSICGELLETGVAFEYRGRAQFYAWLDIVVSNKVRQRLRHARTLKSDTRREILMGGPGLDGLRPGADSPSTTAQLHDELDQLDRALAQLPARSRELIVRRHLLGHSRERIAEDLGIASGVHNQIARAKAKLAAILDRMSARTRDDGP